MQSGLLVSGQLSGLFPSSQLDPILLRSSRSNAPLAPDASDGDLLPEHASQASLIHTPMTGTLLLRVLSADCIVELLSLSSQVAPLRFLFPSPVCKSPAMFLDEDSSLHILAVTEAGSLYRILVPIYSGHELWGANPAVDPHEYLIRNAPTPLQHLVHIQGTDCVGIALSHGALLRIDYQESDGAHFVPVT